MPSTPVADRRGAIAAIVFDFDGVIADTERLHLGAFQDAFAEHQWTLDAADYYDRYVGYDDRGLIVAYAADRRIPFSDDQVNALIAKKMALFSRHLSSGEVLFPGAKTAIQELAARFPVAIASGALHHEIAAILDGAGLLHLFPVIVAADDVATSKPSPEPYLTAAQKLGVDPANTVAIEDTVTGLQAAQAAGMRTIAVTTTAPAAQLTMADHVVAGLHEVSSDLLARLWAPRAL